MGADDVEGFMLYYLKEVMFFIGQEEFSTSYNSIEINEAKENEERKR